MTKENQDSEHMKVEPEITEEDPSTVDVMFWTLTTIPKDIEKVEAAINEITREKINAEIHLNILESGNYAQQTNLIMAGGEKVDLMVTQPGGSAHFNSMTSQGQLTDLTELLMEYAPELMPLAGARKILGTPYLINSQGGFVDYDGLGDGDNAIIGIMEQDGTTIVNNYLREEYVATCELFRDWYEKDYIYKDSANYTDVARALVTSNAAFGYFAFLPTGAQATESEFCGHEMSFIQLGDTPVLTTSKLRQFTWGVPSTSSEKEAAVKFLNLLYSDVDVLNLITWGLEGVHYRTLEDGAIDFLEGEDKDSCGYYIGDITNILGNGYLAKVRIGQDTDLREKAKAINFSAAVSEFVGFTFDGSGLENEVASITNTIEEYRPSLACGLYSEDYYNEFIEKLNAVGAEKYIAEYQRQLDEFLKQK